MSSNSKYDFIGKVVLITGSSSGIGAGIAVKFAQYGASLTITGRNAENLCKIADKIEQISIRKPLKLIGDLLDRDFVSTLVEKTVQQYGRLDVLVNNAGGSSPDDEGFDNAKLLDAYDDVMNLNVRAALQLTQAAVPYLEVNKGCVVNISSDSSIKPWKILYSTSKAALDMLTKTSAGQLASKGIRVNSVNPGPVSTSFGRSLGDEVQFHHDLEQFKQYTALNRIATPEDIANIVTFLASNDAANMTGSIVLSDGGYLVFSASA